MQCLKKERKSIKSKMTHWGKNPIFIQNSIMMKTSQKTNLNFSAKNAQFLNISWLKIRF